MASPACKRQRLSSPTYDTGLEELDSDALKELDRIELTLSQLQRQPPIGPTSSQRIPRSSKAISPNARKRRMKAIMDALKESDDKIGSDASDPAERNYEDGGLGFKSAAGVSRRSIQGCDKSDYEQPSSPGKARSKELEPVSDADTSLPVFHFASKSLLNLPSDDPLSEGTSENQDPSAIGFSTAAGNRGKVLKPSRAALERAEKIQKGWSAEDDDWVEKAVFSQARPKRSSGTVEDFRPPLASVSNSPSVHPPRSPQLRSLSTPLLNRTTMHRPHGFRSPLLAQISTSIPTKGGPSDSSPSRSSTTARAHLLAESEAHDLRFRVASEGSIQFTTPVRPAPREGYCSITRQHKPAFSTPFKKGMRPGEPGREALEKAQKIKKTEPISAPVPLMVRNKGRKGGKVALKDSGLRPRQYSYKDLEDMGLNIAELSQITPKTAPFYVFYTSSSHASSSQTSTSGKISLGPAEALAHLRSTGRNTTKEWVDNHWALVLWKLAGLAALDPAREATSERRWCWHAVLEQLEARHDREFGRGTRPALRLITTGDAPAGSPLVLVVSAILSTEEQQVGQNGKVDQGASAEIEVSDGWYRLRALLDAPLARAVIRGIIKPGRKIAVAGAKLDNERKDPCEILEAYNSCTLLLSGNGSHLAPWHAKLGFQSEPFIATLGSLTPDGGPVPSVDFVVEKVYPIAFFENFSGDRPGERRREGPRGEAEEAAVEDAWRKRREAAQSKVRDELSDRWARSDGLAERLEDVSGTKSRSGDDAPPDYVEDLFDELDALPPTEVGLFIRRLNADECGWLARHIRQRTERDRENAAEEIELEVNHICPPREVRNFRIVQVRDARTARRPANRIAHLCIWDVLSLCVSEGGKAGAIEPGQRFLMTNLVPMQQSCWMGRGKGDMVYLSTTRRSRFYRLK